MTNDPGARAVIGNLVRRLAESYRPEKVILFGSYAHGTPHPDSDIDLLVIKDTDDGLLARMTAVRQAVAGLHPRIGLDPIVLTRRELQARLDGGDLFLREAVQQGEVVFPA